METMKDKLMPINMKKDGVGENFLIYTKPTMDVITDTNSEIKWSVTLVQSLKLTI